MHLWLRGELIKLSEKQNVTIGFASRSPLPALQPEVWGSTSSFPLGPSLMVSASAAGWAEEGTPLGLHSQGQHCTAGEEDSTPEARGVREPCAMGPLKGVQGAATSFLHTEAWVQTSPGELLFAPMPPVEITVTSDLGHGTLGRNGELTNSSELFNQIERNLHHIIALEQVKDFSKLPLKHWEKGN